MSARNTAPVDTGTPVQAYLQGLQHDGQSRLDSWLPLALHHTPASVGADTYDYLCLVGRYLVLGMVQRAMHPGCKFDYCVVLQGRPGSRKSTLVEALAGATWYADAAFDPTEPLGPVLKDCWLYEVSELSAMRGHELAALKQQISSTADAYRPAYRGHFVQQPRQCVFIATTGSTDYLNAAGNRRFWPVPVVADIDVEWVRANRDQLFAEAVAQYRIGAPYWPNEEQEARLFLPMQRQNRMHPALDSALREVLSRTPDAAPAGGVHSGTDFVTLGQVTRALGIGAATSSASMDRAVGLWLEEQGWKHVKRSIAGITAWGYQRPAGSINAQASLPPASQSAPVRSAPPRTQQAAASPASAPLLPSPAAQPQPAPPRFVRHAQSLLRRFGFQLTWTPSGSDGDGASLVIRHARRDKQR
ncbi:virulence-associated E family protein [Pseudacidovorax sp. RU35E]|uniref:virulence-associated E family protein n=1 Tax=Pseudacidovorax sp. RU35E TaxID=1907403 RepID=UPI000954A02F|nr:virulence-associated E family protein [Pseudacidovorax sp. RU35E]SIR00585.1 Virulence-associated protein E [Pseudacidovorax sp. RU35E]